MSTQKDKAPAEPTKPLLSTKLDNLYGNILAGPIPDHEIGRVLRGFTEDAEAIEADRAKLIETLQEMIDSIKEMRGGAKGMFEGIRYGNLIEDDSLYLSLCLRRFDKLLARAKDIGITPKTN